MNMLPTVLGVIYNEAKVFKVNECKCLTSKLQACCLGREASDLCSDITALTAAQTQNLAPTVIFSKPLS